jgi:hypothetical protein
MLRPLNAEKEKDYARAICSLVGDIPECLYWSAYKSKESFQEIWNDRCYWKWQAQKYKQLYFNLLNRKRGKK